MSALRPKRPNGFTIIEVLIVLAIAGLLFLILMMAVPTLQRNNRNVERKRIAGIISAQLEAYKGDYKDYPRTAADRVTFQNNYLAGLVPSNYAVTITGGGAPHDLVGPVDTIMVQYSHWCNRFGDGNNTTDPIAGNHATDSRYVIWTQLEGVTEVYCVDNHG